MAKISQIEGYQILDSHSQPTVEVKIITDNGLMAIDSVPSGISTGSMEAIVVDPSRAVININKKIAPKIKGLDPRDQEKIDSLLINLDGSKNKSNLGANAILGVSLAASRAGALLNKIPLYIHINGLLNKISYKKIKPQIPTLMMVMIEGGKHSKNNICIQEFLAITNFEIGRKIWQKIREILLAKKIEIKLGSEGGFCPNLEYDEDAIDLIVNTSKELGLKIPQEVKIGLDIAANNCKVTDKELDKLLEKWPIYSLEDPIPEDDWNRWSNFKKRLDSRGKDYLLIGDDLFVTSSHRLNIGIKRQAANAIIIKVNQIGTLTEALKVINEADQAGLTHIVSHRGSETLDSFIADLAVGTGAKYLKSGAPQTSERVIKYQRIAEIENDLLNNK